MAASSTHVYDVFIWIKKIIYSTENWKQLNTADQLIELFHTQYNDTQMYKELSMDYLYHLETLNA
jgi:hypothetical protein